jgi:hypothetical protein
MSTNKITDLDIICSQCNISLEDATRIYIEAKGNVVDAIIKATHSKNNIIITENKPKNKKTEIEQKIADLREMANEKDRIFIKQLEKMSQKPPIKTNIKYSSSELPVSNDIELLRNNLNNK